MLGILIDVLILMMLMKIVNDDDVEIGSAFFVALVTSIGTFALSYALVPALGLPGIALTGLIAAIGLGLAVSAIFGVEIKRSFIIGGAFMAIHIAVGIAFAMLLQI